MTEQPSSVVKFDALPHDGREWEVISAGRVGRSGLYTQEVAADLLLAEAGWRQIDPHVTPETRIVRVDVSWLSGLRPGSIVRNGEKVSSVDQRSPGPRTWRQATVTRADPNPFSVTLTGFLPLTGKVSRPTHPISDLEGLRYFPVRLDGSSLAYVPVLELLLAVFRLGGPWLRHMIEGLGLPDRPESGRLVDLSPGSFSVVDGVLACRGFSDPRSRSAPIPVILGDPERHRSYVAVFQKLSQRDFLNSPQFVDTYFPQDVPMICDVEFEQVALKKQGISASGAAVRQPLLVTRVRAARFELGVSRVKIFVPDRREQVSDIPSRVSAQIVNDGELVIGEPVLKSRVAPSRSLETRYIAVEDEEPEGVPTDIVVDPSRSAVKHYRRKSGSSVAVEGSSTGSPHGDTARIDRASLQPMTKPRGITSRMQHLIDAVKLAATLDRAIFRLEAPPSLYDGGDGLWQVATGDLHKLPSWIRPGGIARRIAVR